MSSWIVLHGIMKICLDSVENWWNTNYPLKQAPRRFSPTIMEAIKVEIERLLKANFIQTIRYVNWISNIVPIIKRMIKCVCVCVDFRDLNVATTEDKYPMLVVNMLVNSIAGNEILSLLNGYSRYNQIYIAENDVSKIVF